MPLKVWPRLLYSLNKVFIMPSKDCLSRGAIKNNFRNTWVASKQQIKVVRLLGTFNDGTI
jgi:hypothetical protein